MDIEERRRRDRERKARRRRENPEAERALRRAYYARNAEKIAEANLIKRATKREHACARRQVQLAVRMGDLVPGECDVGGDCFGAIEAHHDDYSRPLEVRWICKGHHMQMHSPLRKTWADRGML
jgi:hypothetical protein